MVEKRKSPFRLCRMSRRQRSCLIWGMIMPRGKSCWKRSAGSQSTKSGNGGTGRFAGCGILCAGYGYTLWRTTLLSILFIAIGAGIFWYADRCHRIVPAQVVVQADLDYGHAVNSHGAQPTDVVPEFFPGYAEFTPLAYSLDVFIPFFILQQESAWFPASGSPDNVWKPSIMLALAFVALVVFAFLGEWIQRRCEKWCGRASVYVGRLGALVVIVAIGFCFRKWLFSDWWWLTVWYWIEIGAGWVLTSLFLLSVTGLLRPRQSSGERD